MKEDGRLADDENLIVVHGNLSGNRGTQYIKRLFSGHYMWDSNVKADSMVVELGGDGILDIEPSKGGGKQKLVVRLNSVFGLLDPL